MVKKPGWLTKRRLNKQTQWFLLLVKEENVEIALSFYEEKLEPFSSFIPKEIRIIYYYYKWLIFKNNSFIDQIEALRSGVSEADILLRVNSILRLNHAKMLSEKLYADNPDTGKNFEYNPASDKGNPLLQFASILLRLKGMGFRSDLQQEGKAEIVKMLGGLPEVKGIDDNILKVFYRIKIYLLFQSGHYSDLIKLLDNREVLKAIEADYHKIREVSLFRNCKVNLFQDNFSEANHSLQELFSLLEGKKIVSVFIRLFQEILDYNPESALGWIESFNLQKDDSYLSGWEQTLMYCQILCLLKSKQLSKARLKIDQFPGLKSSDPNVTIFKVDVDIKEIRALLLHFKSLSYFQETSDWQNIPAIQEQKENIVLGNVSMWREMLKLIYPVIHHPDLENSALTWRNSILQGMISFLDNGAVITSELVEKCKVSVENIEKPETRKKLLGILGELVTRMRATEEAISYITAKDFAHLRDLFYAVLLPQGDVIPSFVRITVILTLWEQDRSFEALKYLRQLKKSGSDETYIDQAINQVQIYEIARKLENECRDTRQSNFVPPSFEPLAEEPQIRWICELANRVVYLKNGNWENARRKITEDESELPDWIVSVFNRVQFYAVWRTGNSRNISQLYLEGKIDLQNTTELQSDGCLIHVLLNHLQSDGIDEAWQLIRSFQTNRKEKQLHGIVFSLAIWLLVHEHARELTVFVELIHQQNNQVKLLNEEQQSLLAFIEGLAYSVLKQYNQAETIFQSLYYKTGNGEMFEKQEHIRGWASLVLIYINIVNILASEKEIQVGLESLKRRMNDWKKQENTPERISFQWQFVECLLLFIDKTRIVDKPVLTRFAIIAKALQIRPKTVFLEQLLQEVVLRQRIIEDFWQANSRSEFNTANNIYEKELIPIFKQNLPFPIQIVKVMIDWNLHQQDTVSLINRLNNIQNKYQEADSEFINKVRNYIKDGDKIKQLAGIIRSNDYNEVIKFIKSAVWEGYKEGTEPVQVALARLLAFHKLKDTNEALDLGNRISAAENLVQWAKDYGNLILGYVYFDNQKYADALKCFEKISRSQLNGHDVNKYWAASHFSIGLQFISEGVDGKENEAFDAFAKAINKRGVNQGNLNLAPLFLHIGLLNLHSQNGSRALASFRLVSKALEGLNADNNISYFGATALIGEFVCKMFMKSEKFTEEDIIKSFNRYKINDFKSPIILRNFLILTLVTNFRAIQALGKKQVEQKVRTTIAELDKNQNLLNRIDPVALVLKASYLILFDKNKSKSEAFLLLNQIKSLGVQSPKFIEFMRTCLNEDELKNNIFETFILFIKQAGITEAVKKQIAANELFRDYCKLNKGYIPGEIVVDEKNYQAPFHYLNERIEALKACNNIDEVKVMVENLEKEYNHLVTREKEFRAKEEELLKKIMGYVN